MACDCCTSIDKADECTGIVRGGGDFPAVCDGYQYVNEGDARTAWAEVESMRTAHRAEVTAATIDTLYDFLHDGSLPCGCTIRPPYVSCIDCALTATAKYPAGVLA